MSRLRSTTNPTSLLPLSNALPAPRPDIPPDEKVPAELWEVYPPGWRGVLSLDTDLGFPDFYPSNPTSLPPLRPSSSASASSSSSSHPPRIQHPHQLTPTFIKSGFSSPTITSINQNSESFSIHHIISEKIRSRGVVGRLGEMSESWGEEKRKRVGKMGRSGGDGVGAGGVGGKEMARSETAGGIPPLAHLPPKRAILNPLMLSLFLTSLSNPLIPLDVLAKTRSIPSGLKGMECLEVLWEGGVDVDAIDSASGGKQDGGSTVGKGDGERKETVSKGGPGGGRLEQLEKKGGERPGHTRTRRMERAGWLIGVIGGHEVQAIRNKLLSPTYQNPLPTLSPSQLYSIEFTSTFVSWLVKQLGELVLPPLPVQKAKTLTAGGLSSATGVGGAVGGKAGLGGMPVTVGTLSLAGNKGPLGQGKDDPSKWLRKWDYSLALLRTILLRPGLIHQPTFYLHMSHLLQTSNLLQVGFVCALIDEFVVGGTRDDERGGLAVPDRKVVRTLVAKLREVREHPLRESMKEVEGSLIRMIRSLWMRDGSENTFGAGLMWREDETLVMEVILSTSALGSHSEEDRNASKERDQATLDRIREKTDRLLMRDSRRMRRITVSREGKEKRHMLVLKGNKQDVSLDGEEQMRTLYGQFFGIKPKSPLDGEDFVGKCQDLLGWAISTLEQVEIRATTACALLKMLEEDKLVRKHNLRSGANQIVVEEIVLDWLTRQGEITGRNDYEQLSTLGRQLQESKLLSYLEYINRLIAMGKTATQRDSAISSSCHLDILRAMPIINSNPGLIHQRSVALEGYLDTGSPVLCDSPSELVSPYTVTEPAGGGLASPESFQAAARRLSVIKPRDASLPHLANSPDPQSGKIKVQDVKPLLDLCHTGIIQLGDMLTGHGADNSTPTLESRQQARPILNLLAVAGSRSLPVVDPLTRNTAPLVKVLRSLHEMISAPDPVSVERIETSKDEQRAAMFCLEVLQVLLLVQPTIYPEFWPAADSKLVALTCQSFNTLLSEFFGWESSHFPLAVEIYGLYLDHLGKEHISVQHNALLEVRKTSPTCGGVLANAVLSVDQGLIPTSIEWRPIPQEDAQTAFQRLLPDKSWDLLPLPPQIDSAETLTHRDDAVDFSKPTNNGSISLAMFGAAYTGDRLSSSCSSGAPWLKLRSEAYIATGNTGRPLLSSPFIEKVKRTQGKVMSPRTGNKPTAAKLDIIELSDEEEEDRQPAPSKRRLSTRLASASGAVPQADDVAPPPAKKRKESLSNAAVAKRGRPTTGGKGPAKTATKTTAGKKVPAKKKSLNSTTGGK